MCAQSVSWIFHQELKHYIQFKVDYFRGASSLFHFLCKCAALAAIFLSYKKCFGVSGNPCICIYFNLDECLGPQKCFCIFFSLFKRYQCWHHQIDGSRFLPFSELRYWNKLFVCVYLPQETSSLLCLRFSSSLNSSERNSLWTFSVCFGILRIIFMMSESFLIASTCR